nr:hypothetical protein 11 [bacterium]
MEKGFISRDAEEKLFQLLNDFLTEKEVKGKMLIMAVVKVGVRFADDTLADKVELPIKEKVRDLIDAILAQEWDDVVAKAIDLIPDIIELFKNKDEDVGGDAD